MALNTTIDASRGVVTAQSVDGTSLFSVEVPMSVQQLSITGSLLSTGPSSTLRQPSISGSVVQFDVSRTNTILDGYLIASGYGGTGNAGSQPVANSIELSTVQSLGLTVDGVGDELVLAAQPIGSAANFLGAITWREHT